MSNKSRKSLLIIDDERTFCIAVRDFLGGEDLEVLTAHSGSEGIAICARRSVDVVLLDQRLPDGDGHSLVPEILKFNEQTKIIFITAYPTFENAITAVRAGAHDYLSKPLDMEELRLTVQKALRTLALEQVAEIHAIEQERESEQSILVGKEGGLAEVAKLVESAQRTTSPVLITGETGTGKNLVAKAIHYGGALGRAPFISVNCASLPENLIETELFGHEKGAFTGAIAARKGMFEMADGGTLFLDEIGELPLHLQSKLLSALEEGTIRRIGSMVSKPITVRIMAATNSDMETALGTRFRKDLYYRLSVVRIHIPPLRERIGDIPLLCNYFLKRLAQGRTITLPDSEIGLLQRYDWPGNVRELKNVLERSLFHSDCSEVRPSLIIGASAMKSPRAIAPKDNGAPFKTLDEAEKELIKQGLEQCNGNITKTARMLGISLSTLKRKIKELRLR
jgi:DNA-binding NtrC family response regulator